MSIFTLFWLPLLIIVSFLLYPKKTKREPVFLNIYKQKGINSFIIGIFFLFLIIGSWYFFLGTAKTVIDNPYGGAAILGFGIILVIPFFIVFFVSYFIRGIKFLFEFNKIKKLINQ
jgi:hypothetical protein